MRKVRPGIQAIPGKGDSIRKTSVTVGSSTMVAIASPSRASGRAHGSDVAEHAAELGGDARDASGERKARAIARVSAPGDLEVVAADGDDRGSKRRLPRDPTRPARLSR